MLGGEETCISPFVSVCTDVGRMSASERLPSVYSFAVFLNSDVQEPWAGGRKKGPSTPLHVSHCGHACTHTEHTVALSP